MEIRPLEQVDPHLKVYHLEVHPLEVNHLEVPHLEVPHLEVRPLEQVDLYLDFHPLAQDIFSSTCFATD